MISRTMQKTKSIPSSMPSRSFSCGIATVGAVICALLVGAMPASAVSFADDFNRTNNEVIGNGWSEVETGTNLVILHGELADSPTSSSAARIGMITRPLDQTPPVGFSLVIKEGATSNKFNHFLFIKGNGSINSTNDPTIPLPSAYGFEIVRSGAGTNNSQVIRFDNGIRIDNVNSSFQFTGTLKVSASFASDGAITGSIFEVETNNTFSFTFPARTAQASGTNVGVGMRDMGAPPGATIDTITIGSAADADSAVSGVGGSSSSGVAPPSKEINYYEPVLSYPNPIIGIGTTMTFSAVIASTKPDTADTVPPSPIISVTVLDMTGRQVVKIQNPGASLTSVPWNTRNSRGEPLASGVYYYVVDFQNGRFGRGKFTLVR